MSLADGSTESGESGLSLTNKVAVVLVVLVVLVVGYYGLLQQQPNSAPELTGNSLPASGDDPITRAFRLHAKDLPVRGKGEIVRLLSDDLDGSRHQRFIIRLDSGLSLLIAHNIDLAPRLDALAAGDSVEFSGIYEWNEKGGVVHWTHHDPQGRHLGGWIKHRGRKYQ
jgi:hypothetical protein